MSVKTMDNISSSTLETLPDEILMTILHYSGDICTVFSTFAGLNQRIDNILIDRRLHLLTDFLCIDINDSAMDYYYNFEEFIDLSHQLIASRSAQNDRQFRQCLQSLVSFHIQYQYQQSARQLQSKINQFQSIRAKLTDEEMVSIDVELKEVFETLENGAKPMKTIKQIEDLVLHRGARLHCSDSEDEEFNFAQAMNHLILTEKSVHQPMSIRMINSFVRMFKNLLISNPKLLYNRASDRSDGGKVIYFFLFHFIYRCHIWDTQILSSDVNLSYYQAAVNLFLFALHGLYHEYAREHWGVNSFVDVLKMLDLGTLSAAQQIFIHTSQLELLKIVMNENIFNESMFWDEESDPIFREVLQNLIIGNRVDVLSFLFQHGDHVRDVLFKVWNHGEMVDKMTGHSRGKKTFHELLNDSVLGTWLATNTEFLFVLLRKKQWQFAKTLFAISPSLINGLDEDGNDPLLYVCLKVRGCRHRFIEYLIHTGCDIQRKNLENQTFVDTLQLERNRELLVKLREHEIIQIDEDFQVHVIHQSEEDSS